MVNDSSDTKISVTIQEKASVHGPVIGTNQGTVSTHYHYHPTTTSFPPLYQLPAPPNNFVGRVDELAAVIEALQPSDDVFTPVCAICGMGGMGKTALATLAAHKLKIESYPDIQLFINLSGSSGVPRSTADALRSTIRAFDPNAALADDLETLAAQYRSYFNNRRALVLLDDAADDDAVEWFRPPSGCALLVTSRFSLTLKSGGQVMQIGLLRRQESRRLFERAARRPNLVSEDVDAIIEQCGDVPLAVQIAAATLATHRTLKTQDYLQQLRDETSRLRALIFDREWDITAVLGLSDDLLSAANPLLARRWRMLGIFSASFDAAAAGAIWDEQDPARRDRALDSLIRRSLLTYDATTELFQMHDLLRDIARERRKAQHPEDETTARVRHARHYHAIAQAANRLFMQGEAEAMIGLNIFESAWRHIRSAAAWVAANPMAETDPLFVDLPRGSSIFDIRAQPREAEAWHSAAVRALRRLELPRDEAYAQCALGQSQLLLRKGQEARASYEAALKLFRTLSERHGEACARHGLGQVAQLIGKWNAAEKYYRQALRIASKAHDPRLLAACQASLGHLLAGRESSDDAVGLLHEADAGFQALGDIHGRSRVLEQMCNVYIQQGDLDQALQCADQLLELATLQRDQIRVSGALYTKGTVLAERGALDESINLFQQAIEINDAIQYLPGTIGPRADLAGAYNALGDYRRALEHLQHALGDALAIGQLELVTMLTTNAGELYRQQGDIEQALTCYRAALQIALDLQYYPSIIPPVSNIATVFAMRDELQEAERLYQLSLAMGRAFNISTGLCDDLHQLAQVYYRQQRYVEAQRCNTEALDVAKKTERGDMLCAIYILDIHLRHALGVIERSAACTELETLASKWCQPREQADIRYARWKIDPADTTAQQEAADAYRALYAATPNVVYCQRYLELTHTLLPKSPLPPLKVHFDRTPASLEELLARAAVLH